MPQEAVRNGKETTSRAADAASASNVVWPEPVRDYVARALWPENAVDGIDSDAVTTKSRAVVAEAAVQKLLDTMDWSKHPLPQELIQIERGEKGAQQATKPVKRNRRGKKGLAASIPAELQQTISPDVSRNGNDMASNVKSRKGWRSTPLLQESPQVSASPNGPASAKKKQRKTAQTRPSIENGWMTEDATDVQDLGDFDFEGNLSKFDKRSVFDQIRAEDTTADEERLVSHNRLPPARPGTYGGKNLHPTENVLSPKVKPLSSDFESASDADTELNFGSGRTSRQGQHPARSGRKPPRRSESGMPAENIMTRSISSLRDAMHGPPSVAASSPNPNRRRSPGSVVSASQSMDNLHLNARLPRPHFRLRTNQQPCTSLTPGDLRQIEADVISRFSLSQEALAENAARGIAQAVLSIASKPIASRRQSQTNHTHLSSNAAKPVVVVLAGNHSTGARAVAAARHLYGRGLKILVCVPEYANPSSWHPQLARQLKILQAGGRKAARIEGWASTSAHIKRLDGPPAVTLDALLDGQRYADLPDQTRAAEVREMIEWANRSRAGVVSVACPSGFDATDGSTTVLEGEPLAVKPEKVVALGVPLQGLLAAVKDGEGREWGISVVDLGINMGLRASEMVQFGSEWVVGLKYSPGEEREAEGF